MRATTSRLLQRQRSVWLAMPLAVLLLLLLAPVAGAAPGDCSPEASECNKNYAARRPSCTGARTPGQIADCAAEPTITYLTKTL